MDKETNIGEILRNAILPEKVDFLGIPVDPAFYTALIVSAVLIVFAVIFRLFIFPRFKTVPGKFQLLIETIVGYFSGLADKNSPEYPSLIGVYAFGSGIYIFLGTCAELFGLRPIFADINAGLAMGGTAFVLLVVAGTRHNRFAGTVSALKEFSMPFSMAFRLFGSLVSGVLATELIYEGFVFLRYTVVLPIFVAVLFTLLHAVMQTYIYTLLTAMFYGEVTETRPPKAKKPKKTRGRKAAQTV